MIYFLCKKIKRGNEVFKLRIHGVIIVCLLPVLLFGNNKYNELQEISYKQTGYRDNPHIQIGVVRLYFKHDPIVNLLSKDMQKTLTLFFPLATVKRKECLQMINTLNQLDNRYFSILISFVNAPIEGISFSIKHDPNIVSITYEAFQSSDLKPGVVVRFFNKHFLQRLQNKGSAVLSTAFLSKPKQLMCITV